MKIPKDKIKVHIICVDGTFVQGYLHVPQGLRLSDFLNNDKENFVVVTKARFSNLKELPFNLNKELFKSPREIVILNKLTIKWLEEIEKYEQSA